MIVLGDGREAPQYGNVFGREASSKWYIIKYRACRSYVGSYGDMGVMRR